MLTLHQNPHILELRSKNGLVQEGIPAALLQVVLDALPEESDLEKSLQKSLHSWLTATSSDSISLAQLKEVESHLVEFAHTTQTEAGQIGRLPQDTAGLIVDPQAYEGTPISAFVTLALALRRFRLLCGLESTVVLIPSVER